MQAPTYRYRLKLSVLLTTIVVILLGAIRFWAHERKLSPKLDKAVAHYNRGNSLLDKGDLDALADKGDLDAAIAEYRKALAIDPNYANAHNNLEAALKRKGH
jgi:tetratricopeptide (TPR) repeat protein